MQIRRLTPYVIEINGKEVGFRQRVDDIVELGDRVILLLNVDDYEFGDMNVGRNILCFGEDGEQLWRIEDHEARLTRGENDHGREPWEQVPYAFFTLEKRDDKIVASVPSVIFTIDPETGEISDPEYYK